MTYLRPFLRLVGIGSLFGHTEDFTFSMSLVTGPTAAPPPAEVPQAIIDAFTALWGSVAISQYARLQTIKLNQIGTNGRYTGDSTVLYDFDGDGLPGVGTTSVPAQLAYCVSLYTDKPRGRAARGRFYLPLPTSPVDATGTLTLGNVQQWAAGVDAFLEAVSTGVPGHALGVVSDVGTGAENYVTQVKYGRVIDTIRSRREGLTENYYDGLVLPAP